MMFELGGLKRFILGATLIVGAVLANQSIQATTDPGKPYVILHRLYNGQELSGPQLAAFQKLNPEYPQQSEDLLILLNDWTGYVSDLEYGITGKSPSTPTEATQIAKAFLTKNGSFFGYSSDAVADLDFRVGVGNQYVYFKGRHLAPYVGNEGVSGFGYVVTGEIEIANGIVTSALDQTSRLPEMGKINMAPVLQSTDTALLIQMIGQKLYTQRMGEFGYEPVFVGTATRADIGQPTLGLDSIFDSNTGETAWVGLTYRFPVTVGGHEFVFELGAATGHRFGITEVN